MTLDNQQIAGLIEQYDKESRAFKEEALRVSWWMRGGVSYDEAMQLSHAERGMINKIIKEHLDTTKESGLPFF